MGKGISIIIITYNEEKNIGNILKSIKKQNYLDYEIIVADANSKDRTREIAKKFRAKVVDGGLPAVGRNKGAKKAKYNLFLFLDADVTLPENFLKDCLKEFYKRKLDVAGINLTPISEKKIDHFLHGMYNFWQIIMQKVDPHMSGAGMFVRKKVFNSVGGFNEDLHIAEDHAFARKSKKRGYRFGILQNHIFLDVRRLEKEGRSGFTFKLFFFWFRRLFGEIKKSKIKYELKEKY